MPQSLRFPTVINNMIQDNLLQQYFLDSLFPKQLFRGMAKRESWTANVGETAIFTRTGILPINTKARKPGVDPTPQNPVSIEQWSVTCNPYNDTIDTFMPNSEVALASLFVQNTQKLGMQAGQTLDHIVRNRLYNAYLSGNAYALASTNNSTSLRINTCEGFGVILVDGRPRAVSAANRQKITVNGVVNYVTGIALDVDDEPYGPGTLTLAIAISATAGEAVLADNRSRIIRAGGGATSNALTANSFLTMAQIRAGVARLRTLNVPTYADGTYHMHLDPTSEAQLFADTEFQRLLRGCPDHTMMKDFALGQLMGVTFYSNNECPSLLNTSTYDKIAGDMVVQLGANAGVEIHRAILLGENSVMEKYVNESHYETEAGTLAKIGNFSITNNGVEVVTEGIRHIIQAPSNRLQNIVPQTWSFTGDWGIPTDSVTGDTAMYKRGIIFEHGAAAA